MASSFCPRATGQAQPRAHFRPVLKNNRPNVSASAVRGGPCFDAHSEKDLGQQWQREMNYERVDNARKIQTRKSEIEKAVEHHMFSRASFFTDSQEAGSSMDALGQAVALQSRLNEAVEKEDFALAASLRDELNEAKARTETPIEVNEAQKPRYDLGQRVLVQDKSLDKPLPAVVVGLDKCCAEVDEWKERNNVSSLKLGEKQPFYHLIIDNFAWRDAKWDPVTVPVAYIPQEKLSAPADEDTTWKQKYADDQDLEGFSHPYSYLLFLGTDNAGDFIPVPELRNLYGAPRKDVYPREDGEAEGDQDASGKHKAGDGI